MAVPGFQESAPLLLITSDGNDHTLADVLDLAFATFT